MGAVVKVWVKSLIDTFTWGQLHSAMQAEDKIRDIEGAIPQCQSRISQRYLCVISLQLSLCYLPKCAAPYLPAIFLSKLLYFIPEYCLFLSCCLFVFQDSDTPLKINDSLLDIRHKKIKIIMIRNHDHQNQKDLGLASRKYILYIARNSC